MQAPAKLLARVRRRDIGLQSDGDLRAAVRRMQSRAADEPAEHLLPECFAIVAEAIDRRLGAWRLFDGNAPTDGDGGTDIVVKMRAEVAWQSRYRRPGDILLPSEFYAAAWQQDEDGRLRFRATDEQLLAGIHLFQGRVVQMDAGEGKTVAIAFAATLHAVLGRGVHVITANDYLALRDATLLEPVYRSLGLISGAVPGYMEPGERRHVYRRNIVYGAMRELGFDYLRDNLKTSTGERVQPPLEVAIIDEADHALIDEAFTPLIISGNSQGGTRSAVRVKTAVADLIEQQRELARDLAGGLDSPGAVPAEHLRLLATLTLADPDSPLLRRHFAAHPHRMRQAWGLAEEDQPALIAGLCYAIAPGGRYVTLTDGGRDHLERRLGRIFDGLPVPETGGDPGGSAFAPREVGGSPGRRGARRYGLANQVSQALRAHLLLQRDVDYLVDDDAVVLIDPHTGRPKPDSIYQHGLQQAVEAREGVTVRPESDTLAQISISGFVSCYEQVAGITGTADTAAGEFRRKYGLAVAVVPPVHPPLRVNRPPVVYLDRQAKLAAVLDEVAARHRTGQPVLVGTRTVEQSEELGGRLAERGIPHQVLNAVATHAEAGIVQGAGAFGAVTVATHMAGRGTDILLEPGLDGSIARKCAAQIHLLLNDATGDTGTVDICCPSPEQAVVLEIELASIADFQVRRVPVRSVGGCGLQVSLLDNSTGRTGRAMLDFALGLCIIGTEVHDSSRITLQLDGRSGRQGQFGLTQTLLSLEDRLVNLDAEAILKLGGSRGEDSAGRAFYSGPDVSRRIQQLQDAADREGEAQRALIQDYSAVLDRQTHLYHQRRQQVIDLASGPEGVAQEGVAQLMQDALQFVASRVANRHLGSDIDGDYNLRFRQMHEELRRDYGLDCTSLYGTDLVFLPEAVAELISDVLERQANLVGSGDFPEVARLLYLQVCGELWPGHLATLRDLVAVQLLSGRNHKSSVAAYIRRSAEAWNAFRELVDEEFLSRLATLPAACPPGPTSRPISVSSETGRLLSLDVAKIAGEDNGSMLPERRALPAEE